MVTSYQLTRAVHTLDVYADLLQEWRRAFVRCSSQVKNPGLHLLLRLRGLRTEEDEEEKTRQEHPLKKNRRAPSRAREIPILSSRQCPPFFRCPYTVQDTHLLRLWSTPGRPSRRVYVNQNRRLSLYVEIPCLLGPETQQSRKSGREMQTSRKSGSAYEISRRRLRRNSEKEMARTDRGACRPELSLGKSGPNAVLSDTEVSLDLPVWTPPVICLSLSPRIECVGSRERAAEKAPQHTKGTDDNGEPVPAPISLAPRLGLSFCLPVEKSKQTDGHLQTYIRVRKENKKKKIHRRPTKSGADIEISSRLQRKTFLKAPERGRS